MKAAKRDPGESLDNLLRRFRRKVNAAGILEGLRNRQAYKSKSEKRRAKINLAMMKARGAKK